MTANLSHQHALLSEVTIIINCQVPLKMIESLSKLESCGIPFFRTALSRFRKTQTHSDGSTENEDRLKCQLKNISYNYIYLIVFCVLK